MKRILANILGGIEHQEVDHYLDLFHQPDKSRFAVVKISGECIETSLEQIVIDLSELQKLDLYPVVLFGWGSILNKKLKEKGIEPKFYEGNRVTDKTVLAEITNVVDNIANSFLELATKYNLRIYDLTKEPIFEVRKKTPQLGYVGQIIDVDISKIVEACNNNTIPLISPLGYHNQQLYNTNADDASRSLIVTLKPKKSIMLTQTGGILSDGKIIRKVSIIDDYEKLIKENIVTGGMLKKLNEAKSILETLPKGYSVQVVSPDNLLTELFTFYGSGTKIVKGYNVSSHKRIQDVDQERLQELLEQSIGKTLIPGYFKTEPISVVVIEEDYDGAAILQAHKGLFYMDKFAVSSKSRNTGLGTEIFSEIIEYPEYFSDKCGLFWRSSTSNPYNKWYFNRIMEYQGGCQVFKDWVVYWINCPEEDKRDLIEFALNKKPTMEAK
jgi:acetylglutamate kinase